MSNEQVDLLDHWPAMVRVARSVLGSRDDAEECASAALAQVLTRRPHDVGNYEAFMVTVAKRRAIDMRRAQGRSRQREARLAASTSLTVVDVAEDITNKAEARWADATARRLLSPKVYGLLQMVADDVPVPEIAQRLQLTTRAVESHLLRARRMMRAALAKTLAGLAVLGLGLRRLLPSASPAMAATAAALLLAVPFVEATRPREVGPTVMGPGYERAVDLSPLAPHALIGAGGRGAGTGAPGVSGASKPRTAVRPAVTKIQGPANTSATVTAEDSGTHEDTAVEMVLACAQNVRVTLEYVGC